MDDQLRPQRPAGFFTEHQRFLDTSQTSANIDRLNLRHKASIEYFEDRIRGSDVLDVASHDGRWSLAALKSGARRVTGIEIRDELVELAGNNCSYYGMDAGAYEFRNADVVTGIEELTGPIDTVLCLGFLYHTLNYNHLLAGFRRTGCQYVIVDTFVGPGNQNEPTVLLVAESVQREGNAAIDDLSIGQSVLVGRPTAAAVDLMFAAHGYLPDRRFDWPGLLETYPDARGVGDYRRGRRITVGYRRADPSDR